MPLFFPPADIPLSAAIVRNAPQVVTAPVALGASSISATLLLAQEIAPFVPLWQDGGIRWSDRPTAPPEDGIDGTAEETPEEETGGEVGEEEQAVSLDPNGEDPEQAPTVDSPNAESVTDAEALGIPLCLNADFQTFDPQQQIIRAEGAVRVQFAEAQLEANHLWVNLLNRFARAEGDVLYTRRDQVLAGDEVTYNISQGSGSLTGASGTLVLNQLEEDFAVPLPNDVAALGRPSLQDRARGEASISQVTSPGGLVLSTDPRRPIEGGEGGQVRRLRFEADRLDFNADGWEAEQLRLTNDPFSPPEIEFRSNRATLTPLNEIEDELFLDNGRVVFDQGLSVPIFRERFILRRGQLDTNDLNPLPTGIGTDGRDRDGVFVERAFSVDTDSPFRLSIAPQFYIERWLNESGGDISEPSNFGLTADLSGAIGPRTTVRATASLPGLDLENFENRLRASVRGQRAIGNHLLNLEYSYRDRLFNGSLGFQDVQNTIGAVLLSPNFVLGDTDINLTYQLAAQYVSATTDRPDLFDSSDPNRLAKLFRFQGSAALSRRFRLWQGEGLPPTATEGLRYTPRPVVPFFDAVVGLRGVATYYTSDDSQGTLTASAGIEGQFGHFSRPFFDYTRFNLTYSRSFVGGANSPFLFDRDVDRVTLSAGIIQQIYGPFRVGIQTAYNLDSGDEIDTDLLFEYSRRAYGLVFRYNPVQATGFLGFRLSDFDWSGQPADFTRRVEGGVVR